MRQYPPHLRHCYCTTLGNEKSIFCRCLADMKENANKFWYFRYLKYGVFLHTDSNKIFHVTVHFLIYYWDQFVASEICHSRCHCSDFNEQHVIQRRKQDFDKSLYLKGYTAKRLTDEFREKSWTKHGVNKLLTKLQDTGKVDIATKCNHTTTGSFQSHPHFTKENSCAFECLIF